MNAVLVMPGTEPGRNNCWKKNTRPGPKKIYKRVRIKMGLTKKKLERRDTVRSVAYILLHYRGTPAIRLKLTYRKVNNFNEPVSRRATAVHLPEFDSSSRDTPLP